MRRVTATTAVLAAVEENPARTLFEIGTAVGVTRERVRQVLAAHPEAAEKRQAAMGDRRNQNRLQRVERRREARRMRYAKNTSLSWGDRWLATVSKSRAAKAKGLRYCSRCDTEKPPAAMRWGAPTMCKACTAEIARNRYREMVARLPE